jgi:DNA polymerase
MTAAASSPAQSAADLAALAWQLELGADEAIGEAPVDRFEVVAPPALPKRTAVVAPAAPPAALPEAAGPAELAAAAGDLAALRAAIEGFRGTSLRDGARSTVFADGDPRARLMVIGEAPGREEDRAGLPFVGPAGQLLDRMLAAIGLSRGAEDPRAAAYITNVLPWRPLANRDPSGDEAVRLLPFLHRHIELADPEVLLLLGTPATRAILATGEGVTRARGRWHAWRGLPVMVTWHPAAVLRAAGEGKDEPMKRQVWSDLLMLKSRLDG